MKKYLFKRLSLMVLVLFGIATIVFFLTRLVPGDPAIMWVGDRATAEQLEAATKELGLDRPLIVQYANYLMRLVQGDLGVSIRTRARVIDEIIARYPATFELATLSLLLSMAMGIPIGILAAVKRNTILDHISRVVSICGVALPLFWLGMILQLILHGSLELFPLQGRISSQTLIHNPIEDITGLYLLDSLLTGNWAAFFSSLHFLALPAMSLALTTMAIIARMSRSTMLEVLQEDFIETAQAYGIDRRTILFKYALKNALIPVITVVGIIYGYTLGGTVVVEFIFDWPGLGKFIVESVTTNDYPAIMGAALTFALTFITVNLIVDLIYFYIDPRIKIPGRMK